MNKDNKIDKDKILKQIIYNGFKKYYNIPKTEKEIKENDELWLKFCKDEYVNIFFKI